MIAQMATTISRSTKKSVIAEKSRATSNVSAQPAEPSTGSLARAREIGKTISEAMSKLSGIDWKRESPAISEAESHLNEVMTLYCENKVSKADVKSVYKDWVNAHRGGLF